MFSSEWIEERVKIKPDRVVVKLADKDGTYKDSVIIPTVYYPLCENAFDVFYKDICKEITDDAVLSIIDQVTYKMGHCYQNSEELYTLLTQAGFDAKLYAGWLFLSEYDYPIHHSWVVLDGSIIDLSDDYTLMCIGNKKWQGTGSKKHWANLIAEFQMKVKKENIPNRIRISTVGIPTDGLLYVGCETTIIKAVFSYRDLMERYPSHTTKRHNGNAGTETQRLVKQIIGE